MNQWVGVKNRFHGDYLLLLHNGLSFFFFLFKLIFIGIQLLYNVLLVLTVKNASAMHTDICSLLISFSFRSPQCIK